MERELNGSEIQPLYTLALNTKDWYLYTKSVNMSKNTSVTLGDYFEKIIRDSIASGRFSSASEVIREGLRLVDEQE